MYDNVLVVKFKTNALIFLENNQDSLWVNISEEDFENIKQNENFVKIDKRGDCFVRKDIILNSPESIILYEPVEPCRDFYICLVNKEFKINVFLRNYVHTKDAVTDFFSRLLLNFPEDERNSILLNWNLTGSNIVNYV